MNFKERGITIGDLLLAFIFIISIFFIINRFKDDGKQTTFYKINNEISTYKDY